MNIGIWIDLGLTLFFQASDHPNTLPVNHLVPKVFSNISVI